MINKLASDWSIAVSFLDMLIETPKRIREGLAHELVGELDRSRHLARSVESV